MKLTIFRNDTPEDVAERFCFVMAELGIRVREIESDKESMTFDLARMTPLGDEHDDGTADNEK